MGIYRLIAVFAPLKAATLCTVRRVQVTLVAVCIFSVLINLPQMLEKRYVELSTFFCNWYFIAKCFFFISYMLKLCFSYRRLIIFGLRFRDLSRPASGNPTWSRSVNKRQSFFIYQYNALTTACITLTSLLKCNSVYFDVSWILWMLLEVGFRMLTKGVVWASAFLTNKSKIFQKKKTNSATTCEIIICEILI